MKKSQGKIGVSWGNQKKMRKNVKPFFTENLNDEELNQKILEEIFERGGRNRKRGGRNFKIFGM